MDVIPVIDLRHGLVVRAVMGRRDLYRPIETPLSASAAPVEVASGLLRLYPFGKLYIADLDAILGAGNNTSVIAELRARFPDLEIWTDNGATSDDQVRFWRERDLGTLVLGSESQADTGLMQRFAGEPRIVLSLDFRGNAFQGPEELLEPRLWPERVIVMTLARIGSDAGPDFDRLARLKEVSPRLKIYAAGGVRGRGDLLRLHEMNVEGALIASALHDGRLTAHDITDLAPGGIGDS
jgi:phosphoribosylformimino-5-aminoimidazole carboxamide ribotide isomerase